MGHVAIRATKRAELQAGEFLQLILIFKFLLVILSIYGPNYYFHAAFVLFIKIMHVLVLFEQGIAWTRLIFPPQFYYIQKTIEKCMVGEFDVKCVPIFAGDCGDEIIVVVNENIIQTTVNYKAGETFYFAGKEMK